MKKVVKFGGSSLASAEQFRKVGEIVRAEEDRRYVVPSAPGKRFNGDTKVTDMLYECYRLAEEGEDFRKELKNIKARYDEIITGLNLTLSLDSEFKTIEENFKKHAGENYAASRGEYKFLIKFHFITKPKTSGTGSKRIIKRETSWFNFLYTGSTIRTRKTLTKS